MANTHTLRRRVKDEGIDQRLEHLSRLAKEADRVYRLASGFADLRSDDGVGYGDLTDGQHEVMLGPRDRAKASSQDVKQMAQMWRIVRFLAVAQFRAFSLKGENGIPDFDGLKSWPASPPTYSFARASLLLVLHKARLQGTSSKNPAFTKDEKTQLLDGLSAWLGGQTAATGYQLCWVVRVLKLLKSVDPDNFAQPPAKLALTLTALEQRLRNRLAIGLQPDSDFPEYEIADMATVLGGRYLNPTAKADPANRSLYTQAVRYVLRGRQPGSGTWRCDFRRDNLPQGSQDAKDAFRKALTNPFASDYSPLAYVLDLPNSVLMPCVKLLSDAASEALGSLKWKLENYLSDANFNGADLAEVNGTVYDGLLIGAAVSDRLKDLLSDAEIDALGAEVPTQYVPWKKLSNSLKFRESLKTGVLNLWEKRSADRPGAILVFGPPGTGKTIIAASLLNELNTALRDPQRREPFEEWRFLALSPADFARHGSDKIIASAEALFQRLQRIRRCVVLLDEMEEFLRARGPDSTEESRLITTAFLPLLQETVDRREIILIVATNFVGTIDSAVTRRGRFDLILPLGPPDQTSRKDIIEDWLRGDHEAIRGCPAEVKDFIAGNMEHVVRYTRGYTWAEIRDFSQELWGSEKIKAKVAEGNDAASRETLLYELWRIRQEKTPMALSGNPGCNWRSFRDETSRFRRPAAGLQRDLEEGGADPDDKEYWDEPVMPR
jgi:hypothetical protein